MLSLQINIRSATRNSTYMFVCYVAYVTHVHDATLVSNHADGDGVFAHLGRHVLVNLDPQILQHQQTWAWTRAKTRKQIKLGCKPVILKDP